MLNQPRYPYQLPPASIKVSPIYGQNDRAIEQPAYSKKSLVLLLMCIVLPMETDGSIVYLALLVILSIDPTKTADALLSPPPLKKHE